MERLLQFLFGRKKYAPGATPGPETKTDREMEAMAIAQLGADRRYAGQALTFIRNGRSLAQFEAFIRRDRALMRRLGIGQRRYSVAPY